MSERALTVEALDAFIGGGEPADDLRLYLDAASVLTAFDPVELKPTAGTEAKADPAIFERLLPLCEPNSAGPHRGLWSLTLAERRAALERLATREAMRAALDTNPKRPDTRAQHVLEQLVDGSLPPLETLDREGLAALVTVSAWLRGFVDVPPEDEVRAALARLDLTAPMWRLVSGGFVNRVAELRQLEAYVTLPVGMPPLFVHGPGGVGKSTLLARFLLTELDRGRPYAYIDLDRPTIRADEPTTLLLDLLDQLDDAARPRRHRARSALRAPG